MSLVLEDLAISLHGEKFIAPFSMEIADGEIVTLMGPSGSGKSTILQAIAGGLTEPFALSGRVLVNGVDLSQVGAERRRIGRLFQDDLLFPHLTVGENLLFGMARGTREQRLALMRDASADVRSKAAELAGERSVLGAIPLLRRLLEDPNGDVRENAVSALSHIADTAAGDALRAALTSKDAKVRRAAAEALGERRR